MPRTINRLSALKVASTSAKGMHPDGAGLYLQITGTGAKSWIFRFKLHKRSRDMGLGSASLISLADVRREAEKARALLRLGIDPIQARKSDRAQELLSASRAKTFDDCASQYIADHKVAWRNPKHVQQWENTLQTYASPVFGSFPVADVDTGLVLQVLKPIWLSKPETASRLRGRIESILGWAATMGYRSGENPARWRAHLENLLPAKGKVRAVKHHEALPYTEVADFLMSFAEDTSISAEAMRFTILTASRTGEALGARWEEFDLEQGIWTVPASRMKAGKQHRVPLSPELIALLHRLASLRQNDFVFPGQRFLKPLSNMALLMMLRRLGRPDITVHGFRSSFRDWVADQTNFPRDVAEMALAHAVGDAVEAAYRRGEMFEKRRRLMVAWANYCCSEHRDHRNNVTPMRTGASV
ncbi:integrase [Rhodoligotrophos appendicifer]|uniref:tyrosine-type recombinase/integrase n=1 Tax=Rhodoligotrophos appendicifer TaxID=987056 RepID=UPI0011864B19|nr:site-specific integrase [Rhodoligotrophos appendicifer]